MALRQRLRRSWKTLLSILASERRPSTTRQAETESLNEMARLQQR